MSVSSSGGRSAEHTETTPDTKTWKAKMTDLSKVTRVEVIDANGRSYMTSNASYVDAALQDDGRTYKVFHQGTPLVVPAFKHMMLLETIQNVCEGMAANTGADSPYVKGVEDMAGTILHILKHHLKPSDD